MSVNRDAMTLPAGETQNTKIVLGSGDTARTPDPGVASAEPGGAIRVGSLVQSACTHGRCQIASG
jgi:hypothetical protein